MLAFLWRLFENPLEFPFERQLGFCRNFLNSTLEFLLELLFLGWSPF